MKKLIFVLLATGNWFAAASRDTVQLHGRISNPLADSVKMSYSFVSIKYTPIELAAKLNSDGSFNFEFEVREDFTSVSIINGNQQTELLVQPGYDLSLTLDGNNFDSTVHYEGKGKDLANFMAKCAVDKHTVYDFNRNAQMLCAKDPVEYEAALKELEEKETDYLQKNGKDLPQPYKDYFKTDHRYAVYATMNMYPTVHEMFKQKSNSVKDIPKESYAVTKDIPEAFDDKYLPLSSYRQYLNNYFTEQITSEHIGEKAVSGDWSSTDSALARAYRRMPSQSAEFHTGNRIFYSIKYLPEEQAEKEFAEYKTHYPHSKNIPILDEAISLKKTMGPGKPAIDFDITPPDGKKTKLSDLKGKVVYIDFWSRSCVPCIGEMPEAKKVRAYFKDKPVAFVYVSLDDESSTWKKAIKDFDIDAINTHVDKGYQSETVKRYGVSGIPSYFLVDKDGKFADVKTVELRSSSEKLIAQIEKLLK